MSKANLIRFLHIPKTAGSTFTDILKRQYWPKAFFEFSGNLQGDRKRFAALSEEDKKRIVLFIGHAPLHTGIAMADQAIVISFLREPVSRVMSFCQHVYEGKSPYLREIFSPQTFNLDVFLKSGNSELSNLQTKMLLSDYDIHELIDKRFVSKKTIIDKALDNLFNRILSYGLTEYFDESLIMIAHDLGWKRPFYFYYRRNIKNISKKLMFKKRHINIIKELNALDIALYESAKRRFLERIEKDASYGKKLKLYQCFNSFIAPMLKMLRVGMKKIKKEPFRE